MLSLTISSFLHMYNIYIYISLSILSIGSLHHSPYYLKVLHVTSFISLACEEGTYLNTSASTRLSHLSSAIHDHHDVVVTPNTKLWLWMAVGHFSAFVYIRSIQARRQVILDTLCAYLLA